MRFELNVDCTPEEARQFFGLPDIMPMQQELIEMVGRRLSENIQTMEADKLIQTWMPAMFQGWSDMQKHFWSQMTTMGGKMSGGINPMSFTMNPSKPEGSSEKPSRSGPKKK